MTRASTVTMSPTLMVLRVTMPSKGARKIALATSSCACWYAVSAGFRSWLLPALFPPVRFFSQFVSGFPGAFDLLDKGVQRYLVGGLLPTGPIGLRGFKKETGAFGGGLQPVQLQLIDASLGFKQVAISAVEPGPGDLDRGLQATEFNLVWSASTSFNSRFSRTRVARSSPT